jgi:hypothetical protein
VPSLQREDAGLSTVAAAPMVSRFCGYGGLLWQFEIHETVLHMACSVCWWVLAHRKGDGCEGRTSDEAKT